jgi:hypothetical protein
MNDNERRMQEIGKAIDDLIKLRDKLIKFKNDKGIVTWLLNRIRATKSYGMRSPIPDEAAALLCDYNLGDHRPEPGSAMAWIDSSHTLFNRAAWEITRRRHSEILAAAETRLAAMDEGDENRARLRALIDYFFCAEEHDWLIGTYSSLGLN